MSETNTALNGTRLNASHPLFNAAKQALLDKEIGEITKLRAGADQSDYDEGRGWVRIRDGKLHIQAGYSSIRGLAENVLKCDYRNVKKRMRVADSFVQSDVEKHGFDKLNLILTYLRKAKIKKWAFTTLELPLPQPGGHVSWKKANSLTIAQVKAALKHQQAVEKAAAKGEFTPAEHALNERLVAALHDPTIGGPVGKVESEKSASGNADDDVFTVTARRADLLATLLRLTRALETPARSRGRT